MKPHLALAAFAAPLLLSATAHAATSFDVTIEVEKPGQQTATLNTTTAFAKVGGQVAMGVETFDSRKTSQNSPNFTTDFGTGGLISGSYQGIDGHSGVDIRAANLYGGADGVGKYVAAFKTTPYALNLTSADSVGGVNYFGYWLSALDKGNFVTFYGDKGEKLFTFNPADVINAIKHDAAYYGNPTSNFLGQDKGEPFVFLNFYDKTGSFSKVVFQEINYGGGYESDNHTVGHYVTESGKKIPTPHSGVPEASTWAMMLLGVGAMGAVLRRRRVAGYAAA